MKDFHIFYPMPPEELEDIRNDNIDVCINMADGSHYTLVVTTPMHLAEMMREEGEYYIHPEFRFVTVSRLERPVIEQVVRELVESPELLALYGSDVVDIGSPD